MRGPIIAAFDPLHEDRSPVELALATAALTAAPVLIAAVAPASLLSGDLAALHDSTVQQGAEAALTRVGALLGAETVMLYDQSIPRALHAIATERCAGLLVIGSTRRGALGRTLPGSTAERVLHGSPCAVALAPRGYERAPITAIAAGFADTPEGHAAVRAAYAFAHRAGARLQVLAAVETSGTADAVLPQDASSPLRASVIAARRRASIENAIERALPELADGVTVDRTVRAGDPTRTLLELSSHVDLLVCGSRGYGPLRGVVLGSVSRRLLNAARCPVLVIPRGAARPGRWLAT